MNDTYQRLAKFLDSLPAGYPPADSGVELRILEKLFTPEQAALFMQMSLLPEPVRVLAYRAKLPVQETARLLREMEQKGLVSGIHRLGKPAEFSVEQFVVGIWENQVNKLDRELIELVDEYLPYFAKDGPWLAVPQIRTIPVGKSLTSEISAMPYEQAEHFIRQHEVFAVRNCICRQERQLVGKGCDKPLETCLFFDGAAKNTVKNKLGRFITKDEALELLNIADAHGLVLQPANSRDPIAMCFCCGCCCGALRNIKLLDQPAVRSASAFIARYDADACSQCGACLERCQVGALREDGLAVVFDAGRCIGCGLCVTTCPGGALTMERREAAAQPKIPHSTIDTYVRMGLKTGRYTVARFIGEALRSGVHRLIAPK